LSDYNLRGSANGVESIKTLRTVLGRNLPAIVMTGDIRSKTIEAIAAAHDISVLIKPFSVDELLRQIDQLHQAKESQGRSSSPQLRWHPESGAPDQLT